jgi:hypothetical protein
MARKKVDCDWKLFDFSLEELGIDTEGSNDATNVSLELEGTGYAVVFEQNTEVRGDHL